jgi:hypothetical protein
MDRIVTGQNRFHLMLCRACQVENEPDCRLTVFGIDPRCFPIAFATGPLIEQMPLFDRETSFEATRRQTMRLAKLIVVRMHEVTRKLVFRPKYIANATYVDMVLVGQAFDNGPERSISTWTWLVGIILKATNESLTLRLLETRFDRSKCTVFA